ncbi:MAG TPA: hypothetical protein VF992_02865 [Thermoplasmata archaeon]
MALSERLGSSARIDVRQAPRPRSRGAFEERTFVNDTFIGYHAVIATPAR